MTKQVYCRRCGRKLKGAVSVKRGIGPGCRRKLFGQQKKFSYATQFPKKPTP